MKWGKSLVTGLVALLLISVMLGNVSGVIASTTPSISQLALPEYDPSPPANSDQIRRAYHTETGKLSFLGIGPGAQPSAQFQFASNASVQDQANAALAAFGDQFGINDPGSELRRMEIQQGSGVLNTVKYQQVFQGVPILAGELIVNMQSSGRLSSISGEISPGLSISTTPGISPEEAADIARSAMAMYYKVDPASFNSSQPELWIFDERLLLPSSWPAELVWRMDVEGNAQLPIRELVLVNAQTGGISLHFNQIDTFWTELGMSNREDSSIQPIPESLPSNSLRPADEWRTFHYDAFAFESRAVQHLSIDVSTTQETAPAFLPGTSWYVATGGNDANDCLNSLSACLTIDAALAKPTFTPGDSILVQEGVYTGSGDQVVLIDKDVTLSGGWDSDFQSQTGRSILDGERTRRVVKTEPLTSVVMDRFHVRNGFVMYDLGGGIASYGDLDLRNSTIRGNRAARGGGLSIDENTASSLFNVEILDNFSEGRGGAIYTDGQLLIVDSVIHNNVATSDGGGIYKNGGSLELEASEVFENKTEQHGGGIYLSHGDQFFKRTSIYSNQAGSGGGGIYQYNGLSILTNSTISGNSTGNEGGGANVYKGSLGLYSSTMVRNSSGEGGGIFTDTGDAFAVLSNSILAENSSGVGPDCSGDQISSNGYSLIGDSTSCPYTPGPGDLVGVDPGLGDMINIPGHFPLRPGSPAIDAGNPLGCEDHLGAAIDADQRGAPRVGRCDIGAYEYAEPGAPSSIIFMGDQSRKFTPNVAAGEPIRALAVDEVNTPVPGVEILFRAPASGPAGLSRGAARTRSRYQHPRMGLQKQHNTSRTTS